MSNRTFYASTYVVADGATRTWPFSFAGVNTGQESGTTPYLYPEDVKVQEIYTDAAGNKQTDQRTGVLNSPNQITIDGPAVLAGREIRIYRETELRFPLVDYRDLQSVSEHDLDLANRQAVFIAQETRDTASANLVYDAQGHFTAGDRRIVNLAPGVSDRDAVNVQQFNQTVRAPTNEKLIELPGPDERKGKVLSFDRVTGQPVVQFPMNHSALELEMDLLSLDTQQGAAKIGRGTIAVDTIADLLLCPRRADLRYLVKEYHAGSGTGGGTFHWNPAPLTAPDNGWTFRPEGVGAGLFEREATVLWVEDFGTLSGTVTSQRAAIEAADARAVRTGAPLCFQKGLSYYADQLFLKSRIVLGGNTTLYKTATTALGFVNWGNKAEGMVGGHFEGFTMNANGHNNVVNLRLYGDHYRTRICDIELLGCDFYALSFGGLSTPGDKDDKFDDLNIDGVFIASERGNTALGTTYSFGLEIFPGTICRNLRIRNVRTVGKIINKIHNVDNLDMDYTNFRASSAFNPLSSGYCEINNCTNVVIGANAVFDTNNNPTYLALLIGGSRTTLQEVTNFSFGGQVRGRLGIEKVLDVTLTSSFRAHHMVTVYNTSGRIVFEGGRMLELRSEATGSLDRIEINGTVIDGGIRFEQAGVTVNELHMVGGTVNMSLSQIRLNKVGYVTFTGTTLRARGTPLPYMLSVQDGTVVLTNVVMDGGGTWERPLLAISATAKIEIYSSTLHRMKSAGLLAPTSHPLTKAVNNVINGALVP